MGHSRDTDIETALVRVGKALAHGPDLQRTAKIARMVGADAPVVSVGRFTVLEHIGRGAMGEVFAAHDDALDRKVALKLLAGQISVDALDRFAREAKALARLSHPNIVQIHEVGEHGGGLFIAMELVDGITLAHWLAPGTRPWRDVVAIFVEAGRGLAAAHAAGLVHRDFKPDNVMVGTDRRVRVLDFGLARAVEPSRPFAPSLDDARSAEAMQTPASPASDRLTQTGALVGTPAYMAPEQLRGREMTPASDQFSFCVALYEGLFGIRPFAGRDPFAIAEAIEHAQFQPPRRSAPRRLAAIVRRGLAAAPEDRWPSMDALLHALTRQAAPRRIGAALALSSGLTALGGGLWYQADLGQRCSGAEEKIAQVWNDARRQDVREAIMATGVSYATATSTKVAALVDGYTTDWAARHRETCEATHVRREQSPEAMDAKMHCLERKLTGLREAIGVLAEADAQTAEVAVDVVAELASPSECDDVDHVRAQASMLPATPEVARRVETERDRLARVRALTSAARYLDAEPLAGDVVQAARDIGDPPLLAEALLDRGRVRDALGRYGEAHDDLLEAYLLGAEHDQGAVESNAAMLLARVVGDGRGNYDEGLRWAEIAIAHSRGAGGSSHDRALALHARSAILRRLGRFEEARSAAEEALRITDAEDGPGSLASARHLESLGSIDFGVGDSENALARYRQVFEILHASLGPHHPDVARVQHGIGLVLSASGDLEGALAAYEAALAVFENVGYLHPNVASTLNSLGLLSSRRGDHRAAIDYMERALAIEERALGPEHPNLAAILSALAQAHQDLEEYEPALKAHQRARAIRSAVLPPGALATAVNITGVGQMLHALGRPDEARATLLDALRELESGEEGFGRQVVIGIVYGNLSRIAQEEGDVDEGIELAEQAVAHAVTPEAPWNATWQRTVLMDALWLDPRERKRAHMVAAEALDAIARAPQPNAEQEKEVRAWIREHPLPESE